MIEIRQEKKGRKSYL